MFPILSPIRPDAKSFQRLRNSSSCLFSAILAIAARFYVRHSEKFPVSGLPPISSSTPTTIGRLAYSHLGATLFRKEYRREDVQAIMLLSFWNLFGAGHSPDPWLVSGHCMRLALRVGLDKAPILAKELHSKFTRAEDASKQLSVVLADWRTWLWWYMWVLGFGLSLRVYCSPLRDSYDGLLSLGYGRPLVVPAVAFDERGFLQSATSLAFSDPTPDEVQDARLVVCLAELSTVNYVSSSFDVLDNH